MGVLVVAKESATETGRKTSVTGKFAREGLYVCFTLHLLTASAGSERTLLTKVRYMTFPSIKNPCGNRVHRDYARIA